LTWQWPRSRTCALVVGLASAELAHASVAAAQPRDFVTLGGSMAINICCLEGAGLGFGPAVNYTHQLDGGLPRDFERGVGGVGWLHYYPSLDMSRLGVGGQASYAFGGAEAA
jgi:hypothetical protein